MTERRPHWDAELCNAVYDAALEAYKDGLNGGAYDIFPIIAAVEDWQIAKAGPGGYAITLAVIGGRYLPEWIAQSAIDRATKAEAAIQRVWELCEDYFHDRSDLDAVESLEAIRRALEGDSDE